MNKKTLASKKKPHLNKDFIYRLYRKVLKNYLLEHSILMSLLYFAILSVRESEPVFI